MKYIVTGINSGLGKYLYENIPNSLGINRDNLYSTLQQIKSDDVIIHCAFNKTNDIQDYYSYLEDNIFLTQQLASLNNRMIYISSIDVYHQDNMYSLFKKFGESIVSRRPNNLILRCPALIGKYMKPNHLFKIKENQDIGLSANSVFNYILYSDVLDMISSDKIGTYDLVSKQSVKLLEVKKLFESNTKFGTYLYMTTNKFTNPIEIQRTSIETIKGYFI
tara:strand:+ start:1057 stop:1716 length:660 start_codon:yes stop_codon:yes gene_type:complete